MSNEDLRELLFAPGHLKDSLYTKVYVKYKMME